MKYTAKNCTVSKLGVYVRLILMLDGGYAYPHLTMIRVGCEIGPRKVSTAMQDGKRGSRNGDHEGFSTEYASYTVQL